MLGIEVLGDGSLHDRFDLFVGTLGYETRSSYLAQNHMIKASRKIALAFAEEDYAAYLSNRDFLKNDMFEILPNDPYTIQNLLSTAISKNSVKVEKEFSILIDISSMSRPMLAVIIHELSIVECTASVAVTFVYLPAEYVK